MTLIVTYKINLKLYLQIKEYRQNRPKTLLTDEWRMPTLQAVLPCPSGFALTGVGADRIYTGAPVSTRRGHTLILICKKKYLNCIRKWEVCIVYTEFIMKSYCV